MFRAFARFARFGVFRAAAGSGRRLLVTADGYLLVTADGYLIAVAE